MNNSTWIDISYAIKDNMVSFPGDPEPVISKLESIDQGDHANVTLLKMSAHTGTHMDAPLHFDNKGKDISQIPMDVKTGQVYILEIDNLDKITLEDLQNAENRVGKLKQGDKVFCKTLHSSTDWRDQPFNDNYVYYALDAISYLVNKEVNLVGIDYLTIGHPDEEVEAHLKFLGNEVWIVEGLDLRNVKEGIYDMICQPVKIEGADGAPASVIIKPFG